MAFQSPTYLGWDGIDLMEISYFPAVFFQTSWDNQLSRAINNILFEIISFEICSLCPRYFEANILCILFLMDSCQICTICFIYIFAEIVDWSQIYFVELVNNIWISCVNIFSFCWNTFDGNCLTISNWFCGNISCNWGQFF